MNYLPKFRVNYPDEEIHQRVSQSLQSRHFSGFRNLDVIVTGGEVTIVGEVQSFYEKQIALTSCHDVSGVLTLIDNIVVCNDRR